jgi:hypothetical protein
LDIGSETIDGWRFYSHLPMVAGGGAETDYNRRHSTSELGKNSLIFSTDYY